VKRQYLIVYDYGMGGLWGGMTARSEQEILQKYPSLKVMEVRPEWMSEAEYDLILLEYSFDIDDEPREWLAKLDSWCLHWKIWNSHSPMMPSQISNTIRRNRWWLNALMFLFSVLVWLDVSSNRNSILHAIGKLGFATHGYGSVNVILLTVALIWSFGCYFIAAATCNVDIKIRPSLYFLFGISSLVTTSSLVTVIFDNWFSIHFLSAIAFEFLELLAAGWISWIIFFRPSHRNRFSDLLGSGLFGIFGLIAVTSVALLFFRASDFASEIGAVAKLSGK
jgi:hypothetical protein